MLQSTIAIIWVIAGAFFWALRDYFNKVSGESSPWLIMGVQMSVGLLCNTMMYYAVEAPWRKEEVNAVKRTTRLEHFFLWGRVVGAFLGISFNIMALQTLALSLSSMIHATAPAFIVMWSRLLLGERIQCSAVVCIFLCLVGLSLSVKPWSFNKGGDVLGYLYATLSAVSTGLAYACLRGCKDLSPSRTIYAVMVGSLVPAFVIGLLTDSLRQPSSVQWSTLIATGLVTFAAEVCITIGYSLAVQGASQVSVYKFLTPVFAMVLDMILLHHIPDWATLLGGAIVLFTAIALMRSGNQHNKETPKACEHEAKSDAVAAVVGRAGVDESQISSVA